MTDNHPGSHPVIVALALARWGEDPDGNTRYIVTLRRPDAHLGGSWEIPGGRVEAGEDPRDAAIREVSEELGTALRNVQPLTHAWYRYDTRTVLLLFFEGDIPVDGPEPKPLAADGLRAVTLPELLKIPFPPANAPLIELLKKRLSEENSP